MAMAFPVKNPWSPALNKRSSLRAARDYTRVRPICLVLLLVVYSIYGLTQPALKPVQAGVAADGGIGLLNGVLCGLTGLPGFIITVWCQLRGWTKDAQRAVFQPVMLGAIVVTAISLSLTGAVSLETAKLYLLGLPAMLGGLWAGFKLYGKLDDAAFRKLILWALLFSGLALMAAQGWPFIRAAD
jgi:uncharacterized protein